MPTKVIGVGVCPRCGRPGTVVIKRGNYVYVKHGNTWHYIGTLDKVNLNKILVKELEITSTPRTSIGHIYGYSYERLLIKAIKYIRLYKKTLVISLASLIILLTLIMMYMIVWKPSHVISISPYYNKSNYSSSKWILMCNVSPNTNSDQLINMNLDSNNSLNFVKCTYIDEVPVYLSNGTFTNITYYNVSVITLNK